MPININGIWKGTIVYGPEYDSWENKELYFKITIIQDGDVFTALANDTGGAGCNPDIALVNGFIDGNEISFVKQYQSTLIVDENNVETVIKGKPSLDINYWGEYSPTTNTLEGEWEILAISSKVGEGWLEDIFTGKWKMEREK